MVDVPAPVTELGLKLTVIPTGSPLAVRETEKSNPPAAEIATVELLLAPRTMDTEAGEADRANDGTGAGAEGTYCQRSFRFPVPPRSQKLPPLSVQLAAGTRPPGTFDEANVPMALYRSE